MHVGISATFLGGYQLDTRKNCVLWAESDAYPGLIGMDGPRFARLPTVRGRYPPFRADSSPGGAALVEDQAVEIVGQIGKRQFRLGARQADRADEKPEAIFLVREDMLDPREECQDVCVSGRPARSPSDRSQPWMGLKRSSNMMANWLTAVSHPLTVRAVFSWPRIAR